MLILVLWDSALMAVSPVLFPAALPPLESVPGQWPLVPFDQGARGCCGLRHVWGRLPVLL